MSHDHDTPAGGPASAVAEPTREPEPDYIARARRILSGDVRPDDYLPTTPEVEAAVAFDLACMRQQVREDFEAGRIPALFDLDPYVEVEQRNLWLLSTHFPQQNIACIEDDKGVIILAVGLYESAALINAFPYEQRKGVGLATPQPLDAI